ncbi:Uncharacterised protein [Candidatus Bartonella washoeensis]|uniref:Uncharacterized protein n=1 Tax=Candidatus Bartonella washoeensis Sb944nv TaxID=1094563 RepID=J1J7K2_9HYPH|nr:hypothetical protein MCQ_00658 [Bartonella washoeensis Sb944nv]SPU26818.1 Uncharacterised protein [Bartonella washoeensis]
MNHEGSLIGVSFVTALSFFSLIAEIGNRSVKASLYLSDSHRSAVESKYKSPLYKLWQCFIKNKPSARDNRAVYSNDKEHSYIQRIYALDESHPATMKTAEDYISQPTAMSQQRKLWCECNLFFLNSNNRSIGWPYIFSFILHVCSIKYMLTYMKKVFRNSKTYSYKKQYFGLHNLIPQIYSNRMWSQLENICSIDVPYDKSFFYRVCC